MVTIYELEASAQQELMGKTAITVNKLARKVNNSLIAAGKEGRYPTFILINQVRHKVGVMFGSPDTQPGGNAFRFFSSMTIKTSGKKVFDKAISETYPSWLEIKGQITKWKVPIVANNFELKIALVSNKGVGVGECLWWNTMKKLMQDSGYLVKSNKGWVFNDVLYKAQDEVKVVLESDPVLLDSLQRKLCVSAMEKHGKNPGKIGDDL